jgi:hypothetical protein
MKKSIAALALSASSASAFGLLFEPQNTEIKTICLGVYEDEQGVKYAGGCDEANNNGLLSKPLLSNGCAEGQIALTAKKWPNAERFDIEIASCLPPNVVQL